MRKNDDERATVVPHGKVMQVGNDGRRKVENASRFGERRPIRIAVETNCDDGAGV